MENREEQEFPAVQLTDSEFSQRMLTLEPYLLSVSKKLDKTSLFPEDLVQDTFARMWENRHMYRYEDSFRAWAKVVMKNVFLGQVIKEKRLGYKIENSEEYSIFDYIKNLREYNTAYHDILIEDVKEAISATLNEKDIKIVSLFLEGYTQEEIALMPEFKTNRNNIKQRYFQAIAKVRTYLRDTLGIGIDEFKQTQKIQDKSSEYRKLNGRKEYVYKKKFEKD
jgi:RNA polymerase sigma-70 factor (ECF subfamily)